MNKITLKVRSALKGTLLEIASKCPRGVLAYGEDTANIQRFCRPINLTSNLARLLSCTHYEVRGLSYFTAAEDAIVAWLKLHLPGAHLWWDMVSPHNWIKYNVASDLCILHLRLASINYYIILREQYLQTLRDKLYHK